MDEEKQNHIKKTRFFKTRLILALLLVAYIVIDASLANLPDVNRLKGCLKTSMFKVNLCPESNAYVRINGISDIFLHTVIVSEDAAFFSHKGIDKHEIMESFKKNLQEGGFARGGSTITQQLIKNVFYDSEKSISRKIQEIYLSGKLEEVLTKKIILERYLNVIEFGKNIYGIKAATNYYFNKHPSDINLLESIYLVHLLPNPKTYSQGFYKGQLTEFSQDRLRTLIERLLRFGRITNEQADFAKSRLNEFPWPMLDFYDNQFLQQTSRKLFSSGIEKTTDESLNW